MKKYDHKRIEKKWQDFWDKEEIYKTLDKSNKPKFYTLVEFPYPSGEGLHTGHVRSYTAIDILSRKRRAEGFNVLYPIGWDAFGLPTENYAIKTGSHPKEVTKKNTDNFRRQLKSLGLSFDWSREINTTDPDYYKWTQWIFLQFFKAGLAYKAEMPINWCLSCKIGLANEEVIEGRCERCGGETEKRHKKQWMLAITKYAEKLLNNLNDLDYLPEIKTQQTNWIGKSEGLHINFPLVEDSEQIKVFTTRPDTVFGVTYVVLAPEHPLIENLLHKVTNKKEVEKYIQETQKKTEIERTNAEKEKTGVRLNGITCKNPVNGRELPIFIADYVLAQYGTGAVMAVPAHDERDYTFAQKYNLPIKMVIEAITGTPQENEEYRKSIVAIVYNPKTEKYLSINWGPALGGNLFIGGGIEEYEEALQCAVREISEETGYKNVNYVATTETVHHHYRAHSKNVNRLIDAVGFYFELIDETQGDLSHDKSEEGKFTVEWLTKDEVKNKVQDPLHSLIFSQLVEKQAYAGEGILVDSGEFTGGNSQEARQKISLWIEKKGWGEKTITYKLRDWVFSRQRYWGEPIPIIACEKCGEVAVPEENLPIELPDVKEYKPSDDGESPLAKISSWVNVPCPNCGGSARRETDVMPNWAGSSWYFLRYIDPSNDKAFANKEKLKHFMPVDWYNGGMEHTTLHLLYSRFWNLFLYDQGFVPVPEPYKKRTAHGMILAEGGVKMSKSKGNVVNPDDIVETYGADTLRVYEMFMGPFNQAIAWNPNDIIGSRKFIEKVWDYVQSWQDQKKDGDQKLTTLLHKTVKKVLTDIENMSFNTAISALMVYMNMVRKYRDEKGVYVPKNEIESFLKVFGFFAPHVGEELWNTVGNNGSLHKESIPEIDETKIQDETVKIAIQVNGKVRDTIEAARGVSKDEIKEMVYSSPVLKKWVPDKEKVKKEIYVENKIFNIVI